MKTFSLLYRDKNLAVIDKSSGVTIADCLQSLTNYLTMASSRKLAREFCISPIGVLDGAASGIQLFGLNPTITRELESNWNTSRATRQFVALVRGDITETGNLYFNLEDETQKNLAAVTNFSPLQNFGVATYLKVWTDTDTQHQIRRHFCRRSMEVVGDRKYGNKRWNKYFEEQMGLKRLFLHAHFLTLDLQSYNRMLEIRCPLPSELDSVLQKLGCFCQSSIWSSFGKNQNIS